MLILDLSATINRCKVSGAKHTAAVKEQIKHVGTNRVKEQREREDHLGERAQTDDLGPTDNGDGTFYVYEVPDADGGLGRHGRLTALADFALLDLLLQIKQHLHVYSHNSPEAVVCRVRTPAPSHNDTVLEICNNDPGEVLQSVIGDLWRQQLKPQGWAEIEFTHRSGESGIRNLDNPQYTYINNLPVNNEKWQTFIRSFFAWFQRVGRKQDK